MGQNDRVKALDSTWLWRAENVDLISTKIWSDVLKHITTHFGQSNKTKLRQEKRSWRRLAFTNTTLPQLLLCNLNTKKPMFFP